MKFQFIEQIGLVNKELRTRNYPQATFILDSEYDLENTPRVLFRLMERLFILDELYLIHKSTGAILNFRKLSTGNPEVEIIPSLSN